MLDITSLTPNELDSLFMNYCLQGDLSNVEHLWTKCDPQNIKRWSVEGLNQAAFWGRQNVVDFFIVQDKEKNLYYNYSNALMAACCNSFEMVQYLHKTVEVDIHNPDELYLPFACKCNQLNTVKYLLAQSEPDYINAHSGQALLYAINHCNWEIVDYLLFSDELPQNALLHVNNDAIFKSIIKDTVSLSYRQDIIKKLVFDYQIMETGDIKLVIQETKSDWANSLFRTRDLYGTLNSELPSNKNIKKAKI